jgi:hypothetical protein
MLSPKDLFKTLWAVYRVVGDFSHTTKSEGLSWKR